MHYRNRVSRKHLAYVASAIAAATGAIGGLGYLTGSPVLAGLSPSYIPMAPSTVATILLVSGGLTAHIRGATRGGRPPAAHLRAAVVVPAGLAACVGLAVIVGRLGPFDLDVESLMLGQARGFFGAPGAAVPLGRMAPLTAAIALGASLSLLCLELGRAREPAAASRRARRTLGRLLVTPPGPAAHLASLLIGACLAVTAAVIIGYAYGTPLLYGGRAIPTALNTAFAYLALSIALLAMVPPGSLLVRPFARATYRGRLLRGFLPLTAALVVGAGWAQWLVHTHTERNPALWAWVAALLSVIAMALLVNVLARRTGGAMERAEATLAESERNLRLLADNTTEAIFAYSMDRRLLFANSALEEIVGYMAGEMSPDGIVDWTHPEDRQRATDVVERAYRGRPGSNDLRLVARDLRVIWCRCSWRPFLDETGRQIGVQGRIRNITDLKEAEETLRLHEETLRQSQKMEAIGRLAGGVAHDFNNLLTAVSGYSDLLLANDELAPALRADVEQIKQSAGRATSLTRQLLAFSRRQPLQPVVLDPNRVITELIPLLARTLGPDIHLRTELAPDLSRVEADPTQLEQVLLNLAVNARDAMPGGGVLVMTTRDVRFAESSPGSPDLVEEGAWVLLSVTDDGTGMDAATQIRIFEPFFTTKSRGQGTGLGLATVFGIVTQSGGRLQVRSAPGEGTVFDIYLPTAGHEPPPATEMQAEEEAGAGPLQPEATMPATILLVEDEPAVSAFVCRVLRRGGHVVTAAATGEEAVRLLDEGLLVSLLVTDVILPGMGGRAVATAARARHPGLEVLYVSGYSEDAIVREGRVEPGLAFLEKPFTPAQLLAKVRGITQR